MGFDGIWPLVMINIVIENCHRTSEFPVKMVILQFATNYQRVPGWIQMIPDEAVDSWITKPSRNFVAGCINFNSPTDKRCGEEERRRKKIARDSPSKCKK